MTAFVYEIRCVLTGAHYIGITTKPLSRRWSQHVQESRANSQTHLHRAMRKYGLTAFNMRVRAELSSAEEAKLAERIAIAFESPALNMTAGGDGATGVKRTPAQIQAMRGRIVSDETRSRIAAQAKARSETAAGRAHLRRAGERAAAAVRGVPQSAELRARKSAGFVCTEATRAKLREARARQVFSLEDRAKMSASAKARCFRNNGGTNQ